jgi:hypothetical protein
MRVVSVDARLADAELSIGASCLASPAMQRALVALAAFGLYWFSAVMLEARDATSIFGADTHLYIMLGEGTPIDRVTRFHPVTTALIVAWMKASSPLTLWLSPQMLYKALFAGVGAAGVWAAMWAFATVGARRHAPLWGIIYATSLGVWYFSSIEESKIVTTTLVAVYIATYLRLRTTWSTRGAVLLTSILLLACLNEIVSAFLVAIPAVDALVRHGWNVRDQLRRNWWIGCHTLAAPAALVFLEVVVNGWLVPKGSDPEGASHLSMLLYYIAKNDFGLGAVYAFAIRWLLFNLAAPSIDANVGATDSYAGDFAPVFTNYFNSPVSTALVLLFVVILAVSLLRPYRGQITRDMGGIMLGLAGYALVRALFFFLVYPGEYMLFSSAVSLPHLLLVAIPFAASTYRRKQALLAALAALLLIVNGTFILGT